ncbi:S1 family peptidase [Nocardia vaccinii]|uniref:S1 family peptidase n=1 Tax=Nocardia vaccinii TaxID=1822 RepID=UPI0008375CA9|nr:S1 family peptidase [Nocardia vaccinii]
MTTVRKLLARTAVLILAVSAWPAAGHAHAAPPAVIGGGSGIVLETDDSGKQALCTLTAIGHDHAGRLVGITAGHCAPSGTAVLAEKFPESGVIGHVARVDPRYDPNKDRIDHDWEIIEFDPARVNPVRQVGATVINGIGVPPVPGQIICKNGRSTGFTCGAVLDSDAQGFIHYACVDKGDSGGPVLLGDRLVGMINHFEIAFKNSELYRCRDPQNPIHSPMDSLQINYALADINRSTNAVGAGFILL